MRSLLSAVVLLLVGPTLAQAVSIELQNKISVNLSSEEPCAISYSQYAIQWFAETPVKSDDIKFASMLRVLVSWGGFRGVGCLEGQIPDPSCGHETQESPRPGRGGGVTGQRRKRLR
jgi:hypothetical protein